jgi:hypothetical protein
MPTHVVTYATHAQGLYDELVGNELGVHVEVLGWGVPWTGFWDKFKGVHAFARACDRDDVIIFLDGFDSQIVQAPSVAVERWRQMPCDVLVSQEKCPWYIRRRIFGTCERGHTANAGMYMGPAWAVEEMARMLVATGDTYDQIALNNMCGVLRFRVRVDAEEEVFRNVIWSNGGSGGDVGDRAVFVSYPWGTHEDAKYKILRSAQDVHLARFFIPEILLVVALVSVLAVVLCRRKRRTSAT